MLPVVVLDWEALRSGRMLGWWQGRGRLARGRMFASPGSFWGTHQADGGGGGSELSRLWRVSGEVFARLGATGSTVSWGATCSGCPGC